MGSIHSFIIFFLIWTITVNFPITAQQAQYRRGIELRESYQTYEQKYQGKDLNEEKRKLFPLESTGVWTELQPKVPRVDYWKVYFVNPDTGLAVGDMGAIIKTINGGQSWYTIENNFNVSIKALGSYSGNPIFAAGGQGLIIKSTDYGESWSVIPSGTTKNFWNIEFINEQTAWLVGDSTALYKTSDGGNSWIAKSTPLVFHTFFDISFLDSLFGYISASGGNVLRTLDGGNTWDVTYVYDIYNLLTIKAVTRQKAVALGYAGKQVNTTDGGESWHLTTYLGSILTDMAFIDTSKGFAVGVSGSFETTDGGESWELRMDMTDGLGITFVNTERGYMVGPELINQKTVNGGESWERTIINDNFTDVFFSDENKGWFIGGQKLYQTTDGGETLIERDDFPGDRPSSVYFLDSLTGIVGAMNKIFKTTDGGVTWDEKNIYNVTGNALEYFRLFFINDQVGWAAGLAGYLIKTIDAGENWNSKLQSPGINGFFFTDTLNGWVAKGGNPFKTTDGGESWIEITNFPASNSWDAFFIDSLNGFISRTNELYKTTDGGTNWALIPDVTNFLYGRFSNITNNLFMAGVPRTYHSTDLGETWNETMDLRDKSIRFVRLSDINNGFAVGDHGLIIKYLDTLYIPVELNSFEGSINNANTILLKWSTVTEVNNKGFEIERSYKNNWKKIGFINGAGNSIEIKNYRFSDRVEQSGIYNYRLKQIDYNGSFKYSKTISIQVVPPNEFSLEQNYPNPFNPVTTISYELPVSSFVTLKVYNTLGEEVATLVNDEIQAGSHQVELNGSNMPSGVYIYRLTAGGYTAARKLVLLK